jgi:hypothetical protein
MNESTPPADGTPADMTREEYQSAMFANMVIQQTNLAMMMLGKAPHPETGQYIQDLDAARMFIDQLEMLEAKTRGNLSKPEEALLKQALPALHMAFVDAINSAGGKTEIPAAHSPAEEPAPPTPANPATPPLAAEPAPAADESRKKFSKKY